jgi:hypothetical protein
MKTKKNFLLTVLICITACTSTSRLAPEKTIWKPSLQLQVGVNNGGIVENTDFTATPNVPVDGFTGATKKVGFNIGTHILLPIKRNAIETGIEYMYNGQSFYYNDPAYNYLGIRQIATSQFMLPLTFNIGLFRIKENKPLFYLKLGYAIQYNLLNVTDNSQQLPAYSYNHWSNGPTLGISTTPFQLKNGASVGIYLDAYRGSKIYDDIYNSNDYEMSGSSYYKFGLIYQFKN